LLLEEKLCSYVKITIKEILNLLFLSI
jgi:hypothetical protein